MQVQRHAQSWTRERRVIYWDIYHETMESKKRSSVEDGTHDRKELIVYDKDTRNEINTTIYEITEAEVE